MSSYSLGGALAAHDGDHRAGGRAEGAYHGRHQKYQAAGEPVSLEQSPGDADGGRDEEEGLCDFHGTSVCQREGSA
jgi:hypothetical protein